MRPPGALRQVALAAGPDLSATLAFWNAHLGLATHARFDPPGIAFIFIGRTRLFFSPGSAAGTVYLDIPDLDGSCAKLEREGVALTSRPARVHVDAEGLFGPAGESEWMAFLTDPAGNTVGLVERRAAVQETA